MSASNRLNSARSWHSAEFLRAEYGWFGTFPVLNRMITTTPWGGVVCDGSLRLKVRNPHESRRRHAVIRWAWLIAFIVAITGCALLGMVLGGTSMPWWTSILIGTGGGIFLWYATEFAFFPVSDRQVSHQHHVGLMVELVDLDRL